MQPSRRISPFCIKWFCRALAIFVFLAVVDFVLDAMFWQKTIADRERIAEPLPVADFQGRHGNESKLSTIHPIAFRREESDHRLAAHRSAARLLEQFTLFGNGDGMFATPKISLFYRELGIDRGWKGQLIRSVAMGRLGLYSGTNVATGFLDRSHEDIRIIVTGCATCHFGRAAGRDVPGLGNKNIDPYILGKGIINADAVFGWLPIDETGEVSEAARNRSIRMAHLLANEQIGNRTQGMVPVANVVRWFYDQQQVAIPSTLTPGAVKVPALWGYGEKNSGGAFCDGFGDGEREGARNAWAGMVELSAGNSVRNIREKMEEIGQLEHALGKLLPPAFPGEVDWNLASEGKTVYSANCQHCHGSYARGGSGFPRFEPPIHFPIELIDTDADRLNIITETVRELVAQSPLSAVIRVHPRYRRGYFAPRLDGIWARFPYLHNGSVPNMLVLLTDPDKRPSVFDLSEAGEASRFDQQSLGLRAAHIDSDEFRRLQSKAKAGARDVYDTTRIGHANRGHAFGTKLTNPVKFALIEYLKTL